jgi:PPOX class probable F420-dependent enzyme
VNSSAEPPEQFRQAPVARLATVRPDGRPHLVPVVFACSGALIYLPIDRKPKTDKPLQRLTNIEHQPNISLLVDHYAEEWSDLWWVRIDGFAQVRDDSPTVESAHGLLRAKYDQYETVALEPIVVVVSVSRVASWSAS